MDDVVRYRESIILLAAFPFVGAVIYTVVAGFYMFGGVDASKKKQILPKWLRVFGYASIGAFIGILLIGVIVEWLLWGTL